MSRVRLLAHLQYDLCFSGTNARCSSSFVVDQIFISIIIISGHKYLIIADNAVVSGKLEFSIVIATMPAVLNR